MPRGEPRAGFKGGQDSFASIWFVAPATLLVRDESDNETTTTRATTTSNNDESNNESFPYRVSGVLERAGDAQWLFRLFNGSEPVTAS